MAPDLLWRNIEKWSNKEHHEKVSFFDIAKFWNVYLFIYLLIYLF